jgi:hypothetical protein
MPRYLIPRLGLKAASGKLLVSCPPTWRKFDTMAHGLTPYTYLASLQCPDLYPRELL